MIKKLFEDWYQLYCLVLAIQVMLGHHLVAQKLHHLGVAHLLVAMGVDHLKKRFHISVRITLDHNVHAKDKLLEFLLINNAILVRIHLFE